jgi:UDP-N-acetylmuramoylalanine--D-glutamate ligase
VRRFGGKDGDARVERGALCVPDLGLELPLSEVGLTGGHNYDNAGAATLLSQHVGVGVTEIAAVLRGFAGLPHRMQQVAVLQGVAFFDDSKATNVGASVAALDGLSARDGRVVLIAGGKDKGGSYAPLVERMRALGRAVVLIGEAAPLIEQAFAGSAIPCARAADMSSAVREARDLAQPGDAVLLAPACSSFDMYRSYAHRGDVFQAAVRALAQTAQEGGAA